MIFQAADKLSTFISKAKWLNIILKRIRIQVNISWIRNIY
jgi:hypothetical protein